MPRYYRRRYGKKRFYRSKVLSQRSIYGSRSSYSQARQISALNKKVKRVWKRTKPEKKVAIDLAPVIVTLSSTLAGSTESHLVPVDISNGSDDYQRIGDKVWRRDVYYLSFEYYNTSSTGYHSSESAGCQLRFILGQYKSPTNYLNSPSTASLIQNYATSGAGYTISGIAPLVNGVTEEHKIWKDLKYNVTTEKNQLRVKISTPWYSCRWKDVYNNNHSWLLVNASGLHYDNDFTEYVEMTVTRKTVFTDV